MDPSDLPAPEDGFVITHFLVVSDQDRSREFYRKLLDGKIVIERDPVIMKVANSWLILNDGGGPTEDKPTVTLETPSDPDRTSAFLNVRAADIQKIYEDWDGKGRVPHAPDGSRPRDSRVRPRPGRTPDRGRPVEGALSSFAPRIIRRMALTG